ncbi:MAG: type II secretion system ATPase GspE [Planctomycetota bacterium]
MGIGETLVAKGLITEARLAEANARRESTGQRLDHALVDVGAVDAGDLLTAMGEILNLPVVDLDAVDVDVDVLRAVPSKMAYRKRLVPVDRANGVLRVATCDPFDLYAFDELRLVTGLRIEPVLAAAEEIDKFLKAHYGLGGETIDEMMKSEDLEVVSAESGEDEDLMEMAQEASVIKLVNEIFLEALNQRASDIHIEPYERELIVRFRVDGVLHEAAMPPQIQRFQSAIISRIKILANLNIAEKRLPQDGRVKIMAGGRQIDIRVSVIPMLFGEGVVMRLLDKSQVLFTLPELGMNERDFNLFNHLITRPHGIMLVTGPTGSGKTTTLYAALSAIVSKEIKVLTVEDPVEYHLDGVNQIQVQPKIGFTFARGLRSILRHDPDVAMIGEIRDLETAEAAVQAALTGHLVFSTLHTNDACSAPTRLLDMGIEPFLITSTVEAAMAQRLVRTICPRCKEAYEPDIDRLPADVALEPGQVLWRGTGCKHCHGTGYYGRTGIYELMVMSQKIRDRIMARAAVNDITAAARDNGMRLLREDGWNKVREGITTPEEVMRVTKG